MKFKGIRMLRVIQMFDQKGNVSFFLFGQNFLVLSKLVAGEKKKKHLKYFHKPNHNEDLTHNIYIVK